MLPGQQIHQDALTEQSSALSNDLDLVQVSGESTTPGHQDALAALLNKPTTTVLKRGEVLYSVAERTLRERAVITGERVNQHNIFVEVNRIMVNSGFPPAHLDGKEHISDRDLPKAWNSITNHTRLVLYTQAELNAIKNHDVSAPPAVGHPRKPNHSEPNMPGRAPVEPESPPKPNEKPKPGEKRPETPNPGGSPLPGQGGGPNDHSVGPPAPPTPTGPDLLAIANQLRAAHQATQGNFTKAEDGQGFLGRITDAAKNTLGSSSAGHAWYDPRSLWSNVLDHDMGSTAIQSRLTQEDQQIQRLTDAAKAKDEAKFAQIYEQLTGKPFQNKNDVPVDELHQAHASSDFDHSQAAGVDTEADILSAVTAAMAARYCHNRKIAKTLPLTMAIAAGTGSATKTALKAADGRYFDPIADPITGGIAGASVPLGDVFGSAVSRMVGARFGMTVTGDMLSARIETQGMGFTRRLVSAAAKSGTTGAVFGGLDSPTREVLQDVREHRPLDMGSLAGTTAKGIFGGFIGGTFLGFTADGLSDSFKNTHPGTVVSRGPTVINGVAIDTSDHATLDQAARILGQNPADFANTAEHEPYKAVQQAVDLYDKHGINIRKFDPITGEPAIPEPFAKMLGVLQTVDDQTRELSSVSLAEKAQKAEVTNKFIDANPQHIEDGFNHAIESEDFQKYFAWLKENKGDDAAEAFRKSLRNRFETDLRVDSTIDQIKSPGTATEASVTQTQAKLEEQYAKKGTDFFNDVTDPAKRERLNVLVGDIAAKFNVEYATREQIEHLIANSPNPELAQAILERSASNSSDMGLQAKLQALSAQIAHETGSTQPSIYTLGADSSGNFLGYMYRKANHFSLSINNFDALGSHANSVVLFDDLSHTSITPAQMARLKAMQNVYVVDIGAFEKGINALDFAKGQNVVQEKLNRLVLEAQQAANQHPGLIPAGAAKAVLDDAVDDAASKIGPNVHVIRPPNTVSTTASATLGAPSLDPVENIWQKINVPRAPEEKIAEFLSGYAGEDRELAAQMLADGAIHNSFPALVEKANIAFAQIKQQIDSLHVPVKDLLIVTDPDPGGSTHLITYLFGQSQSELTPANFVSRNQLNQIISSGNAGNKVLVYLDDTVYSGSQMSGMLESNISSYMPFKKVIVGGIGIYDKGQRALQGTHLAQAGRLKIVAADNYKPFYDQQHPFFGKFDAAAQTRIKGIGGSDGFGSLQGHQLWPYMYPDNNLQYFGKQFGGGVLHLPQ